jgi:hypothetical protein
MGRNANVCVWCFDLMALDGSGRAALPDALTPAEARAIATAIARLPDIMPAP